MPSRPRVDPYVGPRPFGRADQDRFFGREEPTEELFSLVLASRVVIFYGQSGTGKSSLVDAGLRPLLEKDRFDILPTARVQGGLPAGRTALQLGNPYVYFTLLSWGDEAPDGAAEGAMTAALAARARPTNIYGDPASRLLIFDQFEELFASFPACWAQRSPFAAELADCVANDERLRILFVVREDHLADVLSLAEAFPESLRSSMRLPLLGKEEATEAIEGPLRGSDFSYADGVVAELVDDLTRVRVEISPGKVVEVPGDSVEPVQLQVVCAELWRTLPPDTTVITSKHLSSLGDVTATLAHFYDDAVQGTARQVRLDSVFIRRWISAELITSARTRGTAHRGVLLTVGMPNPAVDALENHHLIRAETRAGGRWYELTHDRFLGPIEDANAGAIRKSRAGYWGAAAAVLMIGLLFLDFSPHGRLDLFFRAQLALIGTAVLVQVFWLGHRRRLNYWQPFETKPTRTRMAALTRKTPALLLIVVAWLFCVLIAAYYLLVKPYSCGGRGAIRVLYQNASFTNSCLQEASITVDWALVGSSVLVAAAITFVGSQLSRRLAIRKWQRSADRRAGTGRSQEDAIHIPTHDGTSTPHSAARVGQYKPATSHPQHLGPDLDGPAQQAPQHWKTSQSRASAHRRRTRILLILKLAGAAAIIISITAESVFFLGKSLPPPPAVRITASAATPPVTGDVMVSYRGGKYAHATISGTISRPARGEVAKLTAQQYPFSSPPAVIASTRITGKSRRLSFAVTPSLATRYQIQVFPSSSATTPLSKSRVQTVYVALGVSGVLTKNHCPRPDCFWTIRIRLQAPPTAIEIESSKHLYFYFGLNLSHGATPPTPTTLRLQPNIKVSTPTILSSYESQQILTFTFKIGKHSYSWVFADCVRDTEHKDGIGLPDHHGCGDATVPASPIYLG